MPPRPPSNRPYLRPKGSPPGMPGTGSNDLYGKLLRFIRPSNLRLIALLLLGGLGWLGILPKDEVRGPALVVDGDSLTIEGDRIRLYAIDAPELHQLCRNGAPCGTRARDHLAKLIAGHRLICEKHDTDRYGRDVAQCFIDQAPNAGKPVKGEDIGRAMVRDGQAMAYRSIARLYVADEPPRFDFEPPWEWREQHPSR